MNKKHLIDFPPGIHLLDIRWVDIQYKFLFYYWKDICYYIPVISLTLCLGTFFLSCKPFRVFWALSSACSNSSYLDTEQSIIGINQSCTQSIYHLHNQFISHLPISIIGINQSFTSINHLHKSIIFTNQSFASIHHWHQLIHSVICLNQSFSSINRLLNQSLASIYQWSINESAFILNRKKYIFFLLWAPLIVISWVSNNCSKSLGYQSLRYINTTWTILS